MENQKNDNLNLLEAVVQNTEMGKNTLEQIVPMTEEPRFKAELLRQRNIYRELNQEAHTAITACGGTAQGQSTTPSTLLLMAGRTASASRPGSSSELKMMIW